MHIQDLSFLIFSLSLQKEKKYRHIYYFSSHFNPISEKQSNFNNSNSLNHGISKSTFWFKKFMLKYQLTPCLKLLIFQHKFSGNRKFTLKYHGMRLFKIKNLTVFKQDTNTRMKTMLSTIVLVPYLLSAILLFPDLFTDKL